MKDVIFECEYTNLACNRKYKIEVFGVQSENDAGIGGLPRVVLPPSVISLKSIDYGQYDVPYGMPSGYSATVGINIAELDLSNSDHQLFIEMCINPNKWKLKPTMLIMEMSTVPDAPAPTAHYHFVGKIAVGGADGISIEQTEIELKVPQIFYYVLTNISVPNCNFTYYPPSGSWIRFGPGNIFSVAMALSWHTSELESILPLRRPFAYYSQNYTNDAYYGKKGSHSLLYFPHPSLTERGAGIDRANDYSDVPRADDLSRKDKVWQWRDLWWNYIEFVKPYDVLKAISFIVTHELNKHSRRSPSYAGYNTDFTEIFDKSPLKYNKQLHNGSGLKGASLQFKDLYTINKIHLKYGKLTGKKDAKDGEITEATVFDFSRLARDGRWNNLWEFLETLTLSNLVKVRINSESFIVEKAKEIVNTATRKIQVKQNSPCEVNDIAFNALNPLDNIDIVYLESTQDDITNHRDAINGVSNTKDGADVTMQLVWHNQPPNNAAGWNSILGAGSSGPRILSRIDAKGNIDRSVNWENFGSGWQDYILIARQDLGAGKSGSQFVYLLWYFDNISGSYPDAFNADMPYLVHNGVVDVPIEFSNSFPVSTFIKEIQDKGCVHNQIIQHIRSEWSSGNPTHYGCTLKIPITILESLFSSKPSSYLPTGIFDICNYEIDTVARFGIDLSKAKGWIVMGFKVDYQSGFAEINLINNR